MARDAALIDAGLDVGIGRNVRLGVSFFGQLSGEGSTNAVRGHFT